VTIKDDIMPKEKATRKTKQKALADGGKKKKGKSTACNAL